LLALLLAADCARAGEGTTSAADRVIQSGCEVSYPPFCFADESGAAAGFSVELMRAAAQTMGRDVAFQIGSWNDVKGLLERGEIQALPLVGRTPEREAAFEFTFPYMSLHGAIVVRTDTRGIAELDDLRGRQVAVMQGDNAEEFLRREERGIEIHTTATFEDALRELSAGRYDAVVIQRLVALRLLQKTPLTNLRIVDRPIGGFRQDFCFAVQPGDRESLALLNEGLALVMADGTYRRLHSKWFAALELPTTTRLVIGGDHNYPPYEFLDEQGRPAGYNVDLTRAIAREMGLSIEIRLGPWTDIREGLQSGEIHVAQGMFYSAEGDRTLDFTQAHAMNHYVGVIRRGVGEPPARLDELTGRRIVVQQDSAVHDFLIENGLGAQVFGVETQEDVLRELAAGEYDCAMAVRISALHFIQERGWKNLVLGRRPILTTQYCYAVPNDQQALATQFGEGLRVLRETGEYRQIYDKWLGGHEESPVRLTAILKYVAMVAVPLLLLLAASFLWSRSLRRLVARRTAELRHSQETYRDLVENLSDIVYAVHLDGTIGFASPVVREILGYEPQELVGRPYSELIHPDDINEVQIRFAEAVSGTPVAPYEFRLWDKSGATRWVRASTRLRLQDGKPNGLLGVLTDITEQRRQTARLQQIQRMDSVGRLAGGVAHDFNNLLAVILGYVGLAQADVAPSDPLHAMLVEIKHAGERAATLTRQLLAFSRKQVLQPVAFNLNEVVADLEKMLRRILGEDIEFRVVLAPGLDAILADPGQIEQVIVNMAVNARDAMPRGGKLTIETANVEIDDPLPAGPMDLKPGNYVELAVTDTGGGMDTRTQSQLFEPFFTGKGTGLGLAMAYGIVKQSGGDIGVSSELGKGTTFKVYLPRTERAPPGKPERSTESTIRGRAERILVVEDETALRNLLDRMLTSWGYQVTLTAGVEQALAAIAAMECRPDLVLTDVVMPGSSGAVLAERLRQVQPDLKVLFMSGYTDDAIVHHGVLDSGLPFIQKPFGSAELAAKIAGLLQERKPQTPAQKKILMIDDEPLVRDLVGRACKKRGHDFVGVGNVTAALQALAAKPFDVLLVDMNLLGRDGADALRDIRAAGHCSPAVIFSGDAGSVDMDVLRPLGAVACLEKSGDTIPLMQTLETVTAASAVL